MQQNITELSAIKEEQLYDWKKDGLKKQYEIAQSVIKKLELALLNLDLDNGARARELIKAAKTTLKQCTKELRISDNSEAGWETVNAYNTHPVAEDSDDDKRIRKAEKLAKERVAVRSRKSRGRGRGGARRPFNRGWPNRDDHSTRTNPTGPTALPEALMPASAIPITRTGGVHRQTHFASTVASRATGRTNAHTVASAKISR